MMEEQEPPDDALVGTYQQDPTGPRGRAAIERLSARWRGRVYLWAYRVVREREAALDVSQDAMLQMLRALPGYQARGRFSAWLFTIVHNLCLNAVRRRPLARATEVEAEQLETAAPGPDGGFESAEEVRRILELFAEELDDAERTALWMRAVEAMDVADITRMLNLDGASGARAVLQRARRKLRAALDRSERLSGGER